MSPLCAYNMMNYIQCEQINPYNLTGNEFGYNKKEKISNLSIFAGLPVYAHIMHPNDPIFEINGHKASV